MAALLDGLWMTLQVSALSIALSLLIGVLGAGVRLFKLPVLSQLVVLYVELIRNTPILVQLFFIFYGLPAVGMKLSLYWSGVLCLSLWAGAYQIENLRGAWPQSTRDCGRPGWRSTRSRGSFSA